MTAAPPLATPGQVAFEAFRRVFDTGKLAWDELKPETRQGWELVAEATRRA